MTKAILTLVLLLTVALGASAQPKKISQKDYDAATTAAFAKFKATPVRRRVTTDVTIIGGKELNKRTSIEEYSPGRERVAETIQYGEGKPLDKLVKTERLRIGNWIYELDESGKWTKSKPNSNFGRFYNDVESKHIDMYLVEEIVVDEKTLMQFIYRKTYWQQDSDGKNEVWLDEFVTRVDELGRIIEQSSERGLGSPRVVKSRHKSTFVYSPTDVKIVAPIK